MRWDSRRRLIIREIRHWDPDLVCLQEVDRFQDIVAGMKSRGYEGIYQRRTGDTRDGCAIFWKSKRLRLLEEDSIDFSEFNLRNNVAQICVFEVSDLTLVSSLNNCIFATPVIPNLTHDCTFSNAIIIQTCVL